MRGRCKSCDCDGAKWLFVTYVSASVALSEMVLPQENAIVAFDHRSIEFEKIGDGIRIPKEAFAKQIEEEKKQTEE
jgi:hypothetical protein